MPRSTVFMGFMMNVSVCECFNCLPVSALIDGKIICMHGGLSPDLKQLDQINEIKRPTDIPDSGLLCDLLWSDPDPRIRGWTDSDRVISCVVEDGYEFFAKRRLVTIFSAPNYGGEFENAENVRYPYLRKLGSWELEENPY
ncbi:hypothetical protein SASPL_102688 [Salvia splendens]|uniref:Serine/threonine specific protein phosphatases domain-containing protein n=1 Tax=Salvia splendens TaxID=180675 RepID=A0A8X8YRP9_SALSN|nr:hypothetical protein SASPL_102688 [Salvia splendens]